MDRLLNGDASAWQAFVETHGRVVRSRVADVASTFGRAGDDSAIDDATAEVFAALLSNDGAALRAFAGRSSLCTYIAVIATRSATRGFARRRLIAPGQSQPDLPDSAEDESIDSPVNQLIDAEQQQRVHVLLQRLPEKQRDVVRLFHLKGHSYAQISKQLSMPIGSIGPTLRRAEAKLRQWMEGD